jgi:hypothetical protein
MFFCFACNITTPCVLDVNVKHRIVPNKGSLSHVHVTMKKNWIQPLTNVDEVTFLSMHLENRLIVVHSLKAIQIHGSFSLTLISDLTSFQEHIGDCDISFIA